MSRNFEDQRANRDMWLTVIWEIGARFRELELRFIGTWYGSIPRLRILDLSVCGGIPGVMLCQQVLIVTHVCGHSPVVLREFRMDGLAVFSEMRRTGTSFFELPAATCFRSSISRSIGSIHTSRVATARPGQNRGHPFWPELRSKTTSLTGQALIA